MPLSTSTEETVRSDAVKEERDNLTSKGRLSRLHWVAILLSLGVTLLASYVTQGEVNAKAETKFGQATESNLQLLREQLHNYEGALWGGVAAIQANGGSMYNAQWNVFADNLDVVAKYPGATGIGIVYSVPEDERETFIAVQRVDRPEFDIHPQHSSGELLPITSIEPLAPNAAAVGLDLAFEENRYSGLTSARSTGTAQMTGPIVLVQDAGQTPGFLFAAPWYDGRSDTEAYREANFVGAVYAPFVVEDFVAGALASSGGSIGITITDGDEVLFDQNDPSVEGYDPDPLFERKTLLGLYGRTWVVTTRSTLTFREDAANAEPLIILVGGLVIDSLLIIMFVSLSRSNRRALKFADDLTAKLVQESARLEQSNVELERFAYVASHDLKTPLRGIGNLTEWIEEDLEEFLADEDADSEVRKNLGRLRHQLDRMNALIGGLLEYSRVGHVEVGEPTSVGLGIHLRDLRLDLGLREDQVIYTGPDAVTVTGETLLLQVVSNLVNNAIQHHPDKAKALVYFDVSVGPRHIMFSVGDNGPGIEKEHAERVFEVFQTLGESGTGIGLSVVRKIVDRQGGSVNLQSSPGAGATFTVHWPIHPSVEPHVDASAALAAKELEKV